MYTKKNFTIEIEDGHELPWKPSILIESIFYTGLTFKCHNALAFDFTVYNYKISLELYIYTYINLVYSCFGWELDSLKIVLH